MAGRSTVSISAILPGNSLAWVVLNHCMRYKMSATGSTALSTGSFQPDADIHVTFEDQQKINKFARQNARLEDLAEELKSKQKELQNLEDATEELLMLEDAPTVPYMIGEVFVGLSVDETQEMIEKTTEALKKDIEELQAQCQSIRETMSELKVQLYAKFGNNINLEPDDS